MRGSKKLKRFGIVEEVYYCIEEAGVENEDQALEKFLAEKDINKYFCDVREREMFSRRREKHENLTIKRSKSYPQAP